MTGTAVGNKVGVGAKGVLVALERSSTNGAPSAVACALLVSSALGVSDTTLGVSETAPSVASPPDERVGGGGKIGVGSAAGSLVQAFSKIIKKMYILTLYNGFI